jgi:hypothetical protein
MDLVGSGVSGFQFVGQPFQLATMAAGVRRPVSQGSLVTGFV